MNIAVNRMKLEVESKLKKMEDMMKLIAPFCSEKIKTLGQEAKDLQEKVDEFEDQEKQDLSQFRKAQNARDNAKRASHYWENNKYAEMFRDWLIVLSSANQLLWIYDNQDIVKDPEADDQVVPVITVDKLDGTIECINIFFTEVAPDKPERVIQTRKNTHDKVRKEKTYAYVEYD